MEKKLRSYGRVGLIWIFTSLINEILLKIPRLAIVKLLDKMRSIAQDIRYSVIMS